MNIRFWKTVALGFALLACLTVQASEITVFAAASLTDSLKQIANDYEKKSRDKVVFNFGASSMLARQIEEGAPADVFFSADEAKMDRLEKNDRILTETRKSRLSNSLVVVVLADSSLKIGSADSLTNAEIKRIALADPGTVPAGIYSKAYLEKMKLWSAVETKIVPMDNVRGALAAVESGNVEVGMVYKTDAAISGKVKVVYEVPANDRPDISYSMAVIKESRQVDAAKRFRNYLDSNDSAKVFEKFGFIVRN